MSAADSSTVFVIDDDASVRIAIQELLKSVGLRSQSFASAPEFLAKLPEPGPGCLVLDVRLPGLSGIDFQRQLADAGVQIPIIFITGHGDIPMSVKAMKSGAMEFLTKPSATRTCWMRFSRHSHATGTIAGSRVNWMNCDAAMTSSLPASAKSCNWWSQACSTSRSPPNSAPAKSP